ncbi:MAG: hypothetical protein A2W17_04685 [Planctomycetes bacterium RBG_16_41_13]|nr:MAG: hypothetical protein A2W17_04685 [Planctomycetes bacterium RBG_16_41_13]
MTNFTLTALSDFRVMLQFAVDPLQLPLHFLGIRGTLPLFSQAINMGSVSLCSGYIEKNEYRTAEQGISNYEVFFKPFVQAVQTV